MSVTDQPSREQSLSEDWALVEQLLPAHWQDKARELGAFRRGRVITSAATLLRVMLIHLTDGCALRTTATKASVGGLVSISDVAILKRLRNCAAWFEWMCQELRATWLPAPLQPQLTSCWGGATYPPAGWHHDQRAWRHWIEVAPALQRGLSQPAR